MSLVFEALRRHDGTTATAQPAMGSVLTAGNSLHRRRRWSTVIWLLVSLCLGGGYVLLTPYLSAIVFPLTRLVTSFEPEAGQPASLITDQPVSTNAAREIDTPTLVAANTATERVIETPTPVAANTVTEREIDTPTPVAANTVTERVIETPTPVATNTVTEREIDTSTPVAANTVTERVIETPAPEAPPELQQPPANRDPRQLLASFNRAMSQSQSDEAIRLLADARQTLGRDHMMVLRMQGYYCLQNGCDEQARDAYSTIIARLPEDREAGYNLAVLEWRNGQQTQAKDRVRQLLQYYPGDRALRTLQRTLQERR